LTLGERFGLWSALACVLRTASVSIRRNSAFVFGGCRVIDAFHCAMTIHMGCLSEN
jgi:hypothetical protein